MEVEHAFRAPRSYSTVYGSFKGDIQNLLAAVIQIEDMGVFWPRPYASVGKLCKSEISPDMT